jgi:SAM-dependent methyltransferase
MDVRASIYRVLDQPVVYKAAQVVFAPGADYLLTRRIAALLESLPEGEDLLDLGCGPASWLFRCGLKPTGVDINPIYVDSYRANGATAYVASAAEAPFEDQSFDGIWCVGLLHHLPDDLARAVVREAERLCRPGGYVAILDAVLPRSAWRRPLAAGIRAMDRGEFMRRELELRAVLTPDADWEVHRFTYAGTGLEMLSCVLRKPSGATRRRTARPR